MLVLSTGLVHPSLVCRFNLKQALNRLGSSCKFTFTRALSDLERLEREPFDAVVLYYHRRKIGESALDALLQFAAAGGGVLALHGAMASFKANKRYQELLGGRFIGHGRIQKIHIYTKDSGSELLTEAAEFTVKDELYLHEYDRQNEIVLACDNKGREEPVLWTKSYGSGRVCYFSLGHRAAVFRREEVQKVISGALLWVCRAGGR